MSGDPRPGLAAGLSIALVILGVFFIQNHTDTDTESPPPHAEPAAFDPDQPENHSGRREWENSRLRDPATGRIPVGIFKREKDFAAQLPRREAGAAIGGAPPADKAQIWSHRGPGNVGGRTRALAVDISDPAFLTLLAGGVSGGMWRTTDGGQSWNLTTGSHQLHSVSCVVQDPRPGHEQTWYYGTGEGVGSSPARGGDAYRGDGIFRSDDGGLGWTLLPATSTGVPQETDQPFDYVWNLAVDPTNLEQDEIYAATRGLIQRSLDGGTSWQVVLGDLLTPSLYTDVLVTPAGVVYAVLSSDGGQPGVFRSADGLSWTLIRDNLYDPAYGRVVLAPVAADPNQLLILTSNPEDSYSHELWHYIYLGGDGAGSGGMWLNRSAALDEMPNPYGSGPEIPLFTQRGYNLVIRTAPQDENTWIVGGVHLWRSTNGFSNATTNTRVGGYYYPYPQRTHHADVHDLVFQPGSNDIAYTASDGGVHRTENINAPQVSWTSLNNGYHTTQFFTVALDRDLAGNPAVCGGTQDNGTLWTDSAQADAPWVEIYGGDGAHCAIRDAAAGDYLVSYYRGNMYRLILDENGSMVSSAFLTPDGAGPFLFINPFITAGFDDRKIYLATGDGVWRNNDVTAIPFGNSDPTTINWTRLTTEPAGEAVTALANGPRFTSPLYYGTESGGVYKVLEPAGGLNPPSLVDLSGNAPFPDGAYVSGIAVHPEDDDKVLLCFANYQVPSLWYTQDGGLSWADVEGNLAGDDGPSARCVGIFAGEDGTLWLTGTSTGLYSWMAAPGQAPVWTLEATAELGNVIVDALDIRQIDRTLAVGSHGRGILTAQIGSLSDVPGRVPTLLAQNTPNPFNPSTTIRFQLPETRPARLAVYDLAGRRLQTLVDGVCPAGENQFVWRGKDATGRDQAAGVYLYRLESGGSVEERKMSLVR